MPDQRMTAEELVKRMRESVAEARAELGQDTTELILVHDAARAIETLAEHARAWEAANDLDDLDELVLYPVKARIDEARKNTLGLLGAPRE